MIRVTGLYSATTLPVTMLSDIPVGTVFSGSFTGSKSGVTRTGIFFKAAGPSRLSGADGEPADNLIVQLDDRYVKVPGYMNAHLGDVPVRDYKALDVELVVKGVL